MRVGPLPPAGLAGPLRTRARNTGAVTAARPAGALRPAAAARPTPLAPPQSAPLPSPLLPAPFFEPDGRCWRGDGYPLLPPPLSVHALPCLGRARRTPQWASPLGRARSAAGPPSPSPSSAARAACTPSARCCRRSRARPCHICSQCRCGDGSTPIFKPSKDHQPSFTATSSITQPPHAPPHHQVELRAVCPTAPAASWIASQLAGAASAGVGGAVGIAVQGPLRVVDAHDAPVLPSSSSSSSSSSSPARRALALVTLPLPGLRPVHCVGLSDGAVLVVAAMQPTQPKWIGDEATDQARASSGGGGGGGGGGAAPLLLLSQAHCMPPSVGGPAELQWMSLVADPFRRGWVYARTSRAEVHLLAMGRRSAWTRPGVAAPETVPPPAPALVASRLGAVVSRGHRSAPQRATGMAPGPPSHQVAA